VIAARIRCDRRRGYPVQVQGSLGTVLRKTMSAKVICSSPVELLKTLTKSQSLVPVKRSICRKYIDFQQKYPDFNRLNVCYTFPLFTPSSAGSCKGTARLIIPAINHTISLLSGFAISASQKQHDITSIKNVPVSREDLEAAIEIKRYHLVDEKSGWVKT
jgi:hypothetical protein